MSETTMTPRELLAEADREREIARWAEGMQTSIRLGRPIIISEMHQRGPFGRKRKYLYQLDERMPGPAVDAIYWALGTVRAEAETKADAMEARIVATEDAL